jgi:CspA family cold shock protein
MIEKGVVQNWNDNGYGFIRPDDGGENVFVHATALQGVVHLKSGERVEFEARTCERGRRADYARRVNA